MAVETRTILQKMQHELTNAQQSTADEAAMTKHIENIQLLTELVLEQTPDASSPASPASTSRDVTAREMEAMMGSQSPERTSQQTRIPDDHDGANGESIFDF